MHELKLLATVKDTATGEETTGRLYQVGPAEYKWDGDTGQDEPFISVEAAREWMTFNLWDAAPNLDIQYREPRRFSLMPEFDTGRAVFFADQPAAMADLLKTNVPAELWNELENELVAWVTYSDDRSELIALRCKGEPETGQVEEIRRWKVAR